MMDKYILLQIELKQSAGAHRARTRIINMDRDIFIPGLSF